MQAAYTLSQGVPGQRCKPPPLPQEWEEETAGMAERIDRPVGLPQLAPPTGSMWQEQPQADS